jgi:hypothetical protein
MNAFNDPTMAESFASRPARGPDGGIPAFISS